MSKNPGGNKKFALKKLRKTHFLVFCQAGENMKPKDYILVKRVPGINISSYYNVIRVESVDGSTARGYFIEKDSSQLACFWFYKRNCIPVYPTVS